MKRHKRLLLVVVAAILAIITVGCSANVSAGEIADANITDSSDSIGTAEIADAIMTDSIDADGMPGNPVTSYSSDASTDAVPDGFTTYAQTEGGFSIQYPETWTMLESKENFAVLLKPTEYAVADEEKINAVVVVALKGYAQDATIEEVQQTWNDQMAVAGYENYSSVSTTIDTVNGLDMAINEYSWSYADGDLYTMDFLVLNGADLYVISFTATEDALERLFPYVQQMVLSFNLL